jgi:membrane protein implicated in regulation of membrane protease activity
MLAIAGVLLLVPIVALMWVSSYARAEPRLAGFPFFIWYQLLWVFIASACTYTAYRLVLRARPHRPLADPDESEEGR